MDGYLYLRFFRTLVYICLVGWLLTWAVLLPLYGTSHGNYQQLEKLSYANIDIKIDANRLYTPVFIAWLFLGMCAHAS